MKKYLFLLLGLVCMSCERPVNQKPLTTKKVDMQINIRASNFEHDGHQYIYFKEGGGVYATGGVVHNPDCTCKQ